MNDEDANSSEALQNDNVNNTTMEGNTTTNTDQGVVMITQEEINTSPSNATHQGNTTTNENHHPNPNENHPAVRNEKGMTFVEQTAIVLKRKKDNEKLNTVACFEPKEKEFMNYLEEVFKSDDKDNWHLITTEKVKNNIIFNLKSFFLKKHVFLKETLFFLNNKFFYISYISFCEGFWLYVLCC